MATTRTSLKLTDERQRKIDKTSAIVARDEHDDPPMSKVIDAALDHLLASHDNVETYREALQRGETNVTPQQAAQLVNTNLISLRYRTSIETGR